MVFFCVILISIIGNHLVNCNARYAHWLVSSLALTALASYRSIVKSLINFVRILFVVRVLAVLMVSWFMFAGPDVLQHIASFLQQFWFDPTLP
ncbi:MAG: hypothetical protein ACI84C_001507 [Flavobacteriales bacterium]